MTPAWPRFTRHAVLAAMMVIAGPAAANFTAAQLAELAATPPANAALPNDLVLRDEDERQVSINDVIGGVPAVVVFADYACHTLCGPIVEFAAAGLAKSGLRPGLDYRLLAIGLNPRNGIDQARTMRAKHIDAGSPINRAAVFLTADERSIRAATAALGLTYAYDKQHDQLRILRRSTLSTPPDVCVVCSPRLASTAATCGSQLSKPATVPSATSPIVSIFFVTATIRQKASTPSASPSCSATLQAQRSFCR